jgi:hypothetical protein
MSISEYWNLTKIPKHHGYDINYARWRISLSTADFHHLLIFFLVSINNRNTVDFFFLLFFLEQHTIRIEHEYLHVRVFFPFLKLIILCYSVRACAMTHKNNNITIVGVPHVNTSMRAAFWHMVQGRPSFSLYVVIVSNICLHMPLKIREKKKRKKKKEREKGANTDSK